MCPPVLAAASIAMTAMSMAQQSSAARAQAKHQKATADAKQRIATRQANDAIVRSAQNQRDIVMESQKDIQRFQVDLGQLMGRQAASFAANGSLLDPDSSAGLTLQQTREQGTHQALTMESNFRRQAFDEKTRGETEAWSHLVGAANAANQGAAAVAAGKNAQTGIFLKGTSSLLASGSKFAGMVGSS